MPPNVYVGRRLLANGAKIYVNLAVFDVNGNYTPIPSTFLEQGSGGALVFGPLRNAEVTDPYDKLRRTAIGDAGEHTKRVRRGPWTVNIEAIYDAGIDDGLPGVPDDFPPPLGGGGVETGPFEPTGDYRWGSLVGQYVDFLIVGATGYHIVMGPCGLFEGRVSFPAERGEPIVRNATITRTLGNLKGNLIWGNIRTGVLVNPYA